MLPVQANRFERQIHGIGLIVPLLQGKDGGIGAGVPITGAIGEKFTHVVHSQGFGIGTDGNHQLHVFPMQTKIG